MFEIIYPITGDYRPVLLLLEWCFAFLCGEMGIMFNVKYFKVREKRNVQDLGFSALCFGLSIAWFFKISSNYYILGTSTFTSGIWDTVNLGTFIWDIGYFAILGGGFLFVALIERQLVFYRKYLLTTVQLICTGIFIAFFLWDVVLARMFALVTSFLILGFLYVFIWDLAKKVRLKPGYKNVTVIFFGIIAVFGTGIFNAVDFGVVVFGLEWHLFGICLLLGSFLSFCVILLRFPAVALLEWKQALKELFVITKAGICLVQKSFSANAQELNDSLRTSALTTANMLIREMVANSEPGVSKVKRENNVIFIFSSALVDGAIISNEDNPAIPAKLKEIVRRFEDIYGGIVLNWNGDGSVFGPVGAIIEEVFAD